MGGIATTVAPAEAGPAADAISALVNLGWKRPEAAAAVARAMKKTNNDTSLAALITEALKDMAPR